VGKPTLYHRWIGVHAPSLRRAMTVLAIGAVVFLALWLFVRWELAVVLGWDVAGALFLASVWHLILRADATHTQRLATREDETRAVATILLATVCTASLLSVGYALGAAGHSSGAARALLIAVAILTVTVSWTVLNTVYTLRYAHLYYGTRPGGITFGDGAPAPAYRDFAYVAFTIGMTYQVSDTTLSEPRIRRSVLSQAVLSYIFGVIIIAGAVNLIAGLFH
jgi:uncharacterized membrane protein